MKKRYFLRLGMGFLAVIFLLTVLLPVSAAPNKTIRVSVNDLGTEGNESSGKPAISADGRVVAFESFSTNFIQGGTSGLQIFVRDLNTQKTTLASVSSNGLIGNSQSGLVAISADGRYVAFESLASNLVLGDSNNDADIFVHDRQDNTTILVSANSDGDQGDRSSLRPAISADGQFVAFYSDSTNFPGAGGGIYQIYLKNILSNKLILISANAGGMPGNDSSYDPSISANGCVVAFSSSASNLVPDINNNLSDIFVYDCLTDSMTRVSVATGGAESDGSSIAPSLSADGRFVAFESDATNLAVKNPNTSYNIYVHDRQTGITSLVSVASDGTPGNDDSYSASISADGNLVAFSSEADNLVMDDDNENYDVFVHNRLTGETVRASVSSTGTQGNSSSYNPAISGDGLYVAFESDASNLVLNDNNSSLDIFVRGLAFNSTIKVFLPLVVR